LVAARLSVRHAAVADNDQYVCSECGLTYSSLDVAAVCEAVDRNNRNLNMIGLGFKDPTREALDAARQQDS